LNRVVECSPAAIARNTTTVVCAPKKKKKKKKKKHFINLFGSISSSLSSTPSGADDEVDMDAALLGGSVAAGTRNPYSRDHDAIAASLARSTALLEPLIRRNATGAGSSGECGQPMSKQYPRKIEC
jgi:hypothetical protein